MTWIALLIAACLPPIAVADEGETKVKEKKEKPEFLESGHTADSLDVVKKRLKNKKAVLLDVREQDEWEDGHLEGAKLVPMSAVEDDKLTKEMKKNLPKDKPIYIHCGSGYRVLTVSEILRKKGYDIRPLKDGYSKLLKAGFKKAEEKSGDAEESKEKQ